MNGSKEKLTPGPLYSGWLHLQIPEACAGFKTRRGSQRAEFACQVLGTSVG